MTPWILNGKVLVDKFGRPILCDHCPCDPECGWTIFQADNVDTVEMNIAGIIPAGGMAFAVSAHFGGTVTYSGESSGWTRLSSNANDSFVSSGLWVLEEATGNEETFGFTIDEKRDTAVVVWCVPDGDRNNYKQNQSIPLFDVPDLDRGDQSPPTAGVAHGYAVYAVRNRDPGSVPDDVANDASWGRKLASAQNSDFNAQVWVWERLDIPDPGSFDPLNNFVDCSGDVRYIHHRISVGKKG